MSRRVLVTGGASFIGSHVVERLVRGGDEVSVVDNLSSGSEENLKSVQGDIEFWKEDLLDSCAVEKVFHSTRPEIVYHLAADHGGRGYVELRSLNCANNFALDSNVFQACRRHSTSRVIFASSGCIYPMHLQTDPTQPLYLSELDAGPPYFPDGLYGMAKLVGELTLEQLWKEEHIPSCSCRFFTVYGPRAKENHAVMAMIARSFVRQDPFEVWGDGTQVRNWTYVDDIADGMVLSEDLAEQEGCAVVNLGTMERVTVLDAVKIAILRTSNYTPQLHFLLDKPTGPLNRVADNSRMVAELGLEPMPFQEGFATTYDWYYRTKDREYVRANLERLLVERK